MLDFTAGMGPPPVDTALKQKSPEESHIGRRDGKERMYLVVRDLGEVSRSVSKKSRQTRDSCTRQGRNRSYDADNDSIVSSVSSLTEAKFKEMWHLLRPKNPKPLESSKLSDVEDVDSAMLESSDSSEEELEQGEIREERGEGEGKKTLLLAKEYTLVEVSVDTAVVSDWSIPDIIEGDKKGMWASVMALTKKYVPEELQQSSTLSSSTDSIPDLLPPSPEIAVDVWEPKYDCFGTSAAKLSWYDPIYATMGHLDEVQCQVSDLQQQLTKVPQDPYVTWLSYSILNHQMYDLEDTIREVQECLATHQSVFGAYEEVMEEQLDRWFKGLRDTQERKICGNEEQVVRVEERLTKAEVQDLLLSEKVDGVQAWARNHHVKHGLDNGWVTAMNFQVTSIETKVAIICKILGVPLVLPYMELVDNQMACDLRRRDRPEDEEGSVKFASSVESQGNKGPQAAAL